MTEIPNIGSYKGVPIRPGTQAEINAQVAAINAGLGATPVVQPNPANGASLKGTMTVPAPNTPMAPQAAPTAIQTPQTGSMSPGTFQSLLGQIDNNLKYNNNLISQRQLLIKHLFDSGLTHEELSQLPSDIQDVVKSGDKNAIELQIRVLNDQLQGRANTLDNSVKYLTDAYTKDVADAEAKKQQAIDNVVQFAQVYGSQAGAALRSLYGQDYLDKLKEQGIDLDNFTNIATLAEKKQNADANTSAAGYNGEFAGTIQAAAQNMGSVYAQKQITQALQSALAAKDYGSAYQYILQSSGQGLTAENRSKFQNAAIDNELLLNLKRRLQALADSGYDTSLLKGTQDEIQRKIGTLLTDPKYATIATELDRAFQQYRQNMTGAAFGAAESAEYAKVLPSKSNTLALNLATIDGAYNYNNDYIDGVIKSSVGPGGIYIKEYAEGATPNNQKIDEEEITVISPQGVEGTIPKSQLKEALSEGYTLPAGGMNRI